MSKEEHKETKQDVYDVYQRLYEEFKQCLTDDKLFQSHKAASSLRTKLSGLSTSADSDEVKTLASKLCTQLEADESYKLVNTRIDECKKLLKQIESDDGWTLSWDTDSYTTLYRQEEDLGTYSFKVRGTLNTSVYRILAIIYEVDLYKDWWPHISNSECLSTPSRFRKYGKLESDLPYPVANRESVVDGYGVDNSEENYVLIFIRSLTEQNWEAPDASFPPETDAIVRAVINMGGFLIKPISRDVTEVHYMLNIDPRLAYVPYYLVNIFTGQFIHTILDALRKAAEFDDDSEYARRIKENKAVYGYIQEQSEIYWQGREEKENEEKQENP